MQPSLVVPANGGASARAVARARGGFTEAWHAHAILFHDGAFHGSVTAVRRLASCQQAKEREHVHRAARWERPRATSVCNKVLVLVNLALYSILVLMANGMSATD